MQRFHNTNPDVKLKSLKLEKNNLKNLPVWEITLQIIIGLSRAFNKEVNLFFTKTKSTLVVT